jgi:hypothetical protein
VRTSRSETLYRLLREILNAPTKQPTAAPGFSTLTKFLHSNLRPIVIHNCHGK